MKHKSLLRKGRIAVAVLVFCAFLLLFTDPFGVFHKVLSPLAKLQFWPAVLAMNIGVVVLILAVTAIFGRWYCSCLCPLGILQDGINAIPGAVKKKKKYRFGYKKPVKWLKYPILLVFIVLAALGPGAVAYLLEPYGIFGRMMGSFKGFSLTVAIISAAIIALIIVLTIIGGRTWCTTICPVGTILGIFSKRSMFRPVIDKDACVACGMCGKACKSSCIDTANHKVDTSRCVMCMDCIDNCSSGAIKYKFTLVQQGKAAAQGSAAQHLKAGAQGTAVQRGEPQAPQNTEEAASRRRFLATTAMVATAAVASGVESKAKTVMAALESKSVPERETPVIPPGAKSLRHFSEHCVACHLCVSACPNKVLKPSTKAEYFMLPLMSFEEGFCRPECNACSAVCPAGAIVKVTPEEKTTISIGHAVFNPDNCIVLTDSVSCGNCARHCPSGAISMVLTEDGRIPHVNVERCIGCGRCEYVCPARPVSAIYVEGNQVHREV